MRTEKIVFIRTATKHELIIDIDGKLTRVDLSNMRVDLRADLGKTMHEWRKTGCRGVPQIHFH